MHNFPGTNTQPEILPARCIWFQSTLLRMFLRKTTLISLVTVGLEATVTYFAFLQYGITTECLLIGNKTIHFTILLVQNSINYQCHVVNGARWEPVVICMITTGGASKHDVVTSWIIGIDWCWHATATVMLDRKLNQKKKQQQFQPIFSGQNRNIYRFIKCGIIASFITNITATFSHLKMLIPLQYHNILEIRSCDQFHEQMSMWRLLVVHVCHSSPMWQFQCSDFWR